jgi:serine/threonine protein kinase
MSNFATNSKEDDEMSQVPRLRADDFSIAESEFMCHGGWGAVYNVKKKIGTGHVAMKFFGYTKNRPNITSIRREITLMNSLRGVQGVVQLVGIFDDSVDGLGKPIVIIIHIF